MAKDLALDLAFPSVESGLRQLTSSSIRILSKGC